VKSSLQLKAATTGVRNRLPIQSFIIAPARAKGENSMKFLLRHWHCILPALAISVAIVLMNRDKPKDEDAGKSDIDKSYNQDTENI
jgi:hypothetical protein